MDSSEQSPVRVHETPIAKNPWDRGNFSGYAWMCAETLRFRRLDLDDDNAGVSDTDEFIHHMSPFSPADAAEDFDGDGFTNAEEIAAGSDPNDALSLPLAVPALGPYGTALLAILLTSFAIVSFMGRVSRRA